MKHALVEEQRREAERGLLGKCQICGSVMTPKCGERRVWHWAHRGIRHCDHWWESETDWHRSWKNKFPDEWQEVVHWAENAEKHIADVKTPQGLVIEFQHSYIQPDERRAREAFYKSMIWVVNGLRRKRDRPSFCKMRLRWQITQLAPLTFQVSADRCPLLREWIDSRVAVFFDFGVAREDIYRFEAPVLWRLSPNTPSGWALLRPVPVNNFVEALRKDAPIMGVAVKRPRLIGVPIRQHRTPSGLKQYLARRRRARSRF